MTCDAGKSTLLGHLMYQCDAVGLATIQRYEREAADAEQGRQDDVGVKYAWVFDTLDVERERSMTINITVNSFQSSRFCFTMIDTPGHSNYIKNMITGISQADVGMLVLSAKTYEPSDELDAQSREHLYLAYSMGVKQLLVVVNQMDLVEYLEETYRIIQNQVSAYVCMVGYDPMEVHFVPTNAWGGDNLVEPSSEPKLSWYDGPTILQVLDKCIAPIRHRDTSFRMPIQDVYKIGGVGTVVVGRIETGQITPNTLITIAPGGMSAVVKSIEIHHEPVQMGVAGDNVGLNLKGVVARGVKRGHVLSIVGDESSATPVESFMAQVMFVNHRPPSSGKFTVGYRPVVDCHTAHVSCEFTRILAKIDHRTEELLEGNPKCILSGEACIVEMKPLAPLSIEAFSDFPSLGRFVIRGDDKHAVAVGIIKTIVRTTVTSQKNEISEEEDSD
jgi:elongation factor 1-alpha